MTAGLSLSFPHILRKLSFLTGKRGITPSYEANSFAQGKLFPMILQFSIPAAISLLISAIYNIVDRIFVGNFVGTSALAGLSICFPLSYMMMAFGLMCSAGGASLFSLFAGQREQNRMNASFGNAFGMAIAFELALTVFLQLLADPILQVFGVTQTAYPYAIAYYLPDRGPGLRVPGAEPGVL